MCGLSFYLKMEKDYSLYKSRSTRGIITIAFSRFSATFRQVFRRTWPVALVFCVFWTLLSLVPMLQAPLWAAVVCLVLGGLVELYFYSLAVKLLSGHTKAAFPQGMRLLCHWLKTIVVSWRQYGLTLAVLMLSVLFILLAMSIILLPQAIMFMASVSSHMGMLGGDPSGMPGGIVWLAAVTFFLGGVLRIYIALTLVYCSWYLYGSVVSRRQWAQS